MKTFFLSTLTVVFLLFCTNGIQAQTTPTKLNQVELMKQFLGTWKAETAKDTTEFWDGKSYGTGLESNYKYVTKDKMIKEGKQLWGYDNKFDKFIFADMTKGMDIGISTVWFTSKNICVVISIDYISNPEKAPYKMEVEFKSPDMFLLKTMVSNNIVETITFSRVKN